MNYLAGAISNQGIGKVVNQDAVMVRNRITYLGNVCICVICDGMGGLAEGEVASSHVIRRLSEWFSNKAGGIKRFDKLVYYLQREIYSISEEIMRYGRKNEFVIGTTATVLVMTGQKFAIVHIGDTRVYHISQGVGLKMKQMTTDHSVNEYMLTQSLGMGGRIFPEVIRGKVKKQDMFLMCTDGFRHKNSLNDLKKGLKPQNFSSNEDISKQLRVYAERARRLGERDDITAMIIKVI